METRTDITTLSDEQLRELVGRLSAKLEQMERKNTKLKQMMGDVDGSTTEAAQRQIDVVKCLHKELCGK